MTRVNVMKIQQRPKRKPSILVSVVILSLSMTSCNPKEFTSDAYQLGKETGAQWRDLSGEIQEISKWADENSTEEVEIPEVDKLSACRAMWLLVGWPQFGLENVAEARTDFIEGCLSSIGN